MAFNYLLLALAAVVGIALVLLFNQHLLHRKSLKIKPPMTTKWLARHPDGQISSIEHYYTNENGKRMWKFSESDIPVQAEPRVDYFEEDGAREGNAYFVFRCTRNGNFSVPWYDAVSGSGNPEFQAHFDYWVSVENERKDFWKKENKSRDIKLSQFKVGHAKESRRVDAKYQSALIKKMEMEELLKYGFARRKLGMPQRPVAEERNLDDGRPKE